MFIGYFIVLFLLELIYLRVAERYSIIDKPNERSSHTLPTIRGGGIIFILGALTYSIFNNFCYLYLIGALLLVGVVSFIDDVKGLPWRLRFLTHLLAIGMLLLECNGIHLHWSLIPLFILFIGIVNAYNFMDGINGITGFYSLAVLLPFWYFEEGILLKGFIEIACVSLLVFLFFNARKKARCFAGDIGSIGMALIILFVLLHKIIETGNIQYVFFLTIYGIDSILTLSQRLINGENIFEPHRKHLYQILVNEYKLPHLLISAIYASIQLILNSWIIMQKPSNIIVVLVVLGMGFIYLGLKYFLIKNYSKKLIDN